MLASLGGGLTALVMSYIQYDGKIEVLATINGVLGALVGVTGKANLYVILSVVFYFVYFSMGVSTSPLLLNWYIDIIFV